MPAATPPLPTGTLKVLADQSGISAATLSRVLNHPDQVRPALRAKAEAVLAKAGYVPHGAARSLTLRRTLTMGVVVPTVDSALFARIVEGLQHKLNAQRYQLLLASSAYEPAREASEVRALIERGIDGVMLIGTRRGPGVIEMLQARRIPFVTTCHHDAGSAWPTLGWDNVAAAERMADYLLDIGHRRFGVLAGITRDNDRAADRVLGFRRALARRGVELPDAAVIERPYTVAEARGAMAMLLRRAQPPTAVMCGNDILAYGALQECLWRELRVPEQISITGFDDIEMAAHCKPGITTLHVPAFEIGQQAGARLLAAAAAERPLEPDHLCCELELVVRGTTAPPAERRETPAAAPAPRTAPRRRTPR
ncbi:LacI family DNA-binding transcriptional regulator [Piscinibacter sakaiensis]|uniref:LacI family DNA-binding transcriptional regulator n=1 Tax=Piscinibacter sakaiensis TaxID=1547922 RepID=UPI0006B66EBC|nr:substrate-binding domain-containing protein [Piscinibacter sakaiensis]